MFKKLLKYDFRSIWRIWWIALIVLPIASVIGAASMRFMSSSILEFATSPTTQLLSSLLTGIATIIFIACFLTIFASNILVFILVYLRFYKHLFSDEGYLTFTLPASRREILLAKTVNAVIWTALHSLLSLFSSAILIIFAIPTEDGTLINTEIFTEIKEAFDLILPGIWEYMGGWSIVYLSEFFIAIVSSVIFGICLIHLCITIGAVVAKKAKLLVSIAIYYGITTAISLIGQAGSTLFVYSIGIGLSGYIDKLYESGAHTFAIALIILLVIAVQISLCALMYCLTQWLIDRKLNLA